MPFMDITKDEKLLFDWVFRVSATLCVLIEKHIKGSQRFYVPKRKVELSSAVKNKCNMRVTTFAKTNNDYSKRKVRDQIFTSLSHSYSRSYVGSFDSNIELIISYKK